MSTIVKSELAVPYAGTRYFGEKLSLLVVGEVASTILPDPDHGGCHPVPAAQITAAMQWILPIHCISGPTDNLFVIIPTGQAEIC